MSFRRFLLRAWSVLLEILAIAMLLGGFVFFFALAPPSRVSETPRMANTQKPTLGRVVLYSFLDKQGKIVERPATIVAVWPSDTHGANLHVLLDGTNDRELVGLDEKDLGRMSFWATSIAAADNHATAQAGRWRWPPRE